MADRELIAVVVKDGVVYGPGYVNPPPPDVAALILNPNVWGDTDSNVDDGLPKGNGDEDEAPSTTEPTVPTEPAPGPTSAREEVEAPPRSGKGSGFPVWKAFADAHEVSYPADATREDIIDACEAAKLI